MPADQPRSTMHGSSFRACTTLVVPGLFTTPRGELERARSDIGALRL